ncbi:MAG: ribosome maturation factor RimM [Synechococcales cyanobacterium CRU_2_2]|nr:ribosome maturation factor RimM [Synechococcales cyanobacterium CRU_2_2]
MQDDWMTVGRIVSAQGMQGEVRVYPESDFPERFLQPGDRWLLRPNTTEPQQIRLLSGRYVPKKNLYVIRLAGVVDRDQAEALRDTTLVVPVSDRPPLDPGEFHILDLIGLSVVDQTTQMAIGVVVDVLSAGNDLLEVAIGETPPPEPGLPDLRPKVLIPFVYAIVPTVDLKTQRIEIVPPPGLLELQTESEETQAQEKEKRAQKKQARRRSRTAATPQGAANPPTDPAQSSPSTSPERPIPKLPKP